MGRLALSCLCPKAAQVKKNGDATMKLLPLVAATVAMALTAGCDTLGFGQDDMGSRSSSRMSSESSLGLPDSRFVEQAAIGGLFEVESSRLALNRSENSAVRQFAQRLIQDHGQANQELNQLARTKGMTPPDSLSGPQAERMQDLRDVSSGNFDRRYIMDQIQAHRQTIDLFQTEARNGQDRDLTAFAQRTLPTLNQHLDMAERLSTGGAVSSR